MERMSYHTDRFKWNDFILFPVLITFLIVFIGQFAGSYWERENNKKPTDIWILGERI